MARNYILTDTVTIANSATVSSTLSLQGSRILLGLITPAALTGTTFTFKGSIDGTNFYNLYNEGTAYSVTVAVDRFIALDRETFDGVRYVQVVSGSVEGASRSIKVVSGE